MAASVLKIRDLDYANYGHSLGGLIAYLLTRKLIKNGNKLPLHLFITGTTRPSSLSRTDRKRHLLPQKEFLNEMKQFGGIPDEIIANEEWLYYFEPILRADFKASEHYIYEDIDPFDIPITVITGTEENIEPKDIMLWQKETKRMMDFRQMPGNHFFIFKHAREIVDIIIRKLNIYTKYYQS